MHSARFAAASVLITLISASAVSADPVSVDQQGALHFQGFGNTVVITRNLKVTLNGKLLANCSSREMIDVEDDTGNEVTCVGSNVSVELANGTEIDISGSLVSVETPDGEDYSLNWSGPGSTKVRTGAGNVNVQAGSTDVRAGSGNIGVSIPGLDLDVFGAGGVNVDMPGQGVDVDTSGGGVDVKVPGQGAGVTTGIGGITTAVPGLDLDLNGQGFVGINGESVNIKAASEGVSVDTGWRTQVSRYTKGIKVDSLMKEMNVQSTTHGLKVEMAGDVLFDFDSESIRSDAAASLAKISQIIRAKLKERVVVVGHTDSKGSDSYNQHLSERRALSVIKWLNQKESIPGYYLYAQGKGEMQPKAPNTQSDGRDDREGRALNRRVEIYIQ